MNVRRDRVLAVLRGIGHEVRAERVTFLAGSIAYNAFLALLPLLFLLLAVVSSVGSTELEGAFVELTRSVITPGAAEVLSGELQQASVELSALGLAILVWGALRIFRSLDTAFSDIYESQAECTFATQIKDGVTVLVCLVAVVAAVLLVEARIDIGGGTVGWLLQRAVLFCALALALAPMFYLFPDEDDLAVVEAIPGVVVAALGLLVLQSAFGLYVEYSSTQATNSVLASVIVFLTYLYFTALVLLVGAAVNAMLTNRTAEVNIRPVIGDHGVDALPADRVDGGIPEAELRRLVRSLPTASEVTITVDGTRFDLPPPERVDSDVTTSSIPFVNETGHIELHWTPRRDEQE